MKIGIITFHKDPNHGAFLQAFATMKVVESLGHDARIINYENKFYKLKNILGILKYRRPVRFLDRFSKSLAFRRDQKQMKLTKYTTDPNKIKKNRFDCVIIGSDIVWNYLQIGFDDIYFGNVNAKKIISYAPSFGWINYDEKIPHKVQKSFELFNSISVRDDNSQKILEKITGIKYEIVVDPTLLFDFTNYELNTKRSQELNNYILVYAYHIKESVILNINNFAKENNLKTIAIGYRQDWCDLVFMDVGPFEWLNFIKNASYIFTSTFHGAIFSIKYKKEFIVSLTDSNSNKVNYLLYQFGLLNRIISKNNFYALLNEKIDYDKIEDQMRPLINNSKKYLIESIGK